MNYITEYSKDFKLAQVFEQDENTFVVIAYEHQLEIKRFTFDRQTKAEAFAQQYVSLFKKVTNR